MKSNARSKPRVQMRTRRNAVREKPGDPATKRGRATRERLKTALMELLQERAYHDIRLEDITARANARVSLFYHYFQSKTDITQEVLADLLGSFKHDVARREKDASPLSAIHHANQRMVALYASNPGAMRCLLDTREDTAPFAKTWRALTLDWNRRIAASIARQFPDALPGGDSYLAFAYALSGMVDNFLFEYYVHEQPALRAAYPTQEDVASLLTTLWCRALYLHNPGTATSPGFEDVRS